MRKIFLITAVTGVLLASTSITSYAAQWKSDSVGWWWEEDDGSYPVSQWKEINGKSYYFGQDGYMLANTTTPDGYLVGEDGAWIEGVSDELPTAPYADKIQQYKDNTTSFSCEISFRKEDLQDRGKYYELKNHEVYRAVENIYENYDYELIHTGSVYFYKNAEWVSGVTFEAALNDANISRGYAYPMEEGYYYWTLLAPDEKGYFTMFSPDRAG